MYRISSNKCPGAYFLQDLQDPALKWDQGFIHDPTLISYRLFRRYGEPTNFISHGAPTCSLDPAVKHQAFKRDPAFIQILCFFEEIRYMLWIRRWYGGAVICKICIKAKTLYKLASHKLCIYLSSLCSICVYVNVLHSIYLKLILRFLIKWSHSYHICFLVGTGCKEH